MSDDSWDIAPPPFNADNALALFAELPDLYDDWEARAKKAAAFREARERSRVFPCGPRG